MTFNALETSRTKSRPIALYDLTYGDGPEDYYGYTDGESTVNFGGRVYYPAPVDRDAVTSSGSLDNSQYAIRMDKNADIGDYFVGWPPSRVVILTVWQGHVGDAEFKVTWAGRITGVARDGNEITFNGEPVTTSMGRIGLRRNWCIGCPLLLYGEQCRADKAAATVTATVTAVESPFIDISLGWQGSRDRDSFINGTVSWEGNDGLSHIRNIMRVMSTTRIRASGSTATVQVGSTITLVLGCTHDQTACRLLHDNIHNYGGQDWIPLENPFGVKNNFY